MRAKKNQLGNLLTRAPRQLPSYVGDRFSAYLAEQLAKPGREILRQFIYPTTTRFELEALPVKVLLPRKWVTRSWSFDAIEEDMFKLTWNLVRLMGSDFGHIDAVGRAFSAPGGLSILNGKNRTGKTTVAALQALQAALCGHKVLITGPAQFDVYAIANRLQEMLKRMDDLAIRDNHENPKMRVYWATSIWEDMPSTDELLMELRRARARVGEGESAFSLLRNRIGPVCSPGQYFSTQE